MLAFHRRAFSLWTGPWGLAGGRGLLLSSSFWGQGMEPLGLSCFLPSWILGPGLSAATRGPLGGPCEGPSEGAEAASLQRRLPSQQTPSGNTSKPPLVPDTQKPPGNKCLLLLATKFGGNLFCQDGELRFCP